MWQQKKKKIIQLDHRQDRHTHNERTNERTNMYIYIKIRSKIVICVRKLYNIIYRTATNLHNKRYKYATLTTNNWVFLPLVLAHFHRICVIWLYIFLDLYKKRKKERKKKKKHVMFFIFFTPTIVIYNKKVDTCILFAKKKENRKIKRQRNGGSELCLRLLSAFN